MIVVSSVNLHHTKTATIRFILRTADNWFGLFYDDDLIPFMTYDSMEQAKSEFDRLIETFINGGGYYTKTTVQGTDEWDIL